MLQRSANRSYLHIASLTQTPERRERERDREKEIEKEREREEGTKEEIRRGGEGRGCTCESACWLVRMQKDIECTSEQDGEKEREVEKY